MRQPRLIQGCRMTRGLLIAAVILAQALRAQAAESAAKPDLVLSAIENEQTHALAMAILSAAYARLGLRVAFELLPARRALEWAELGRTDGDVARIEGTEKGHPHLVQVKTPVLHFKGMAFTRHVTRDIRSPEDLAGLRVGVIRGIQYSTRCTEGLDRFFANDMFHLFTLLEKDRIAVAVGVLDAGRVEIERHFPQSGIHAIGRPLFAAPLYHFLHLRHRGLSEKLDTTLLRMTEDGEIQGIYRETLERLMQGATQ